MKLYRCWTCGVKLVNVEDGEEFKNHIGHQFRNYGTIYWDEYPKILFWKAQEWLKK